MTKRVPRGVARCMALVLGLALAGPAAAQDVRTAWPGTDFGNRLIDLDTVRPGGPPRDGIPALNDPGMVPAARETGLAPDEAVLVVALQDHPPRAYPLRYLLWHEIANDRFGGTPVAITYCPLCNSAQVFDRRVGARVLEFGVSGLLRHSDMIMFDRETESWWQQATGEAVVGELAGSALARIPAWVESWTVFRETHPGGLVMAEPQGWQRPYGRNPYVGYDTAARPFLYEGKDPPHGIPPLVRVVRVGTRAWPMTRLRAEGGRIEEAGLSIHWAPGMASALDTPEVGAGRDTGLVRVRDAEGRDVAHDILFAFAFHAFWPYGTWMLGD
ncbi:MAG: DUF3179 domain-containing protein [Pseudooceanicola sp.]